MQGQWQFDEGDLPLPKDTLRGGSAPLYSAMPHLDKYGGFATTPYSEGSVRSLPSPRPQGQAKTLVRDDIGAVFAKAYYIEGDLKGFLQDTIRS